MTKLPPAWRVKVAEHVVARWMIPAQELRVLAVDETRARIAAARRVQVAAGIPAWRPWLRMTFVRSSVVGRDSDVASCVDAGVVGVGVASSASDDEIHRSRGTAGASS